MTHVLFTVNVVCKVKELGITDTSELMWTDHYSAAAQKI